MANANRRRFVTLGPRGSCHENAVTHYLAHHRLADASVLLVDRLLDGLEQVRRGEADWLVQCSAHLDVHLVTERYHPSIVIADTFLFPTREIVLLEDARVASPQTLGLVKATEGYLDDIDYPNRIYEISKPVVGANLLAGKYDAGLTTLDYHDDHPGRFRLRKYIGAVLTSWLVYGMQTIYRGRVAGVAPPGFYEAG